MKATDTHYQVSLGGDKSVEAFLKASGVTAPADSAGASISFEFPKADCTSSKASPYAINCSGRQVQLRYSTSETIEAAFLNLNVVDRTDTSGVGSARSIIIELQNIDIGLTSGKYVFARYYRDLPIDYCSQ